MQPSSFNCYNAAPGIVSSVSSDVTIRYGSVGSLSI